MAPAPSPVVDKLTVWQRDAQKLVEVVECEAAQLPPIDLADADRSLPGLHATAGSAPQIVIEATAKISGSRLPVRHREIVTHFIQRLRSVLA
jgi:hypothetical protein